MYFTAFVSHSVSKKDNVSVSFRVVPIEKESPTIEHIKYDTGSQFIYNSFQLIENHR